jgi:hypothetical protein
MMDAMHFLFLLEVPKHCVHPKTMGPLGARNSIVTVTTIHNIIIEWQLDLPSQR